MTAGSPTTCLFCRARLTWCANLFKACFKQHHLELAAPLRRFIPEDAVVLDVGGHAGQFAKLFARLAPKGRVISVEPGAYALSILRIAIRINRLGNISIVASGLSDTPGEATLNVPVKPSGSIGFGLSHIGGPASVGRPSVSETIPLTTVDLLSAAEGLQRLDFIKADIEGWELRMIVGAEETLRRFRPALMLEVNREALAKAGDTPEALFAYFDRLDYRGFALSGDGSRFEPAPVDRNNDIFFVPAERVDETVSD